jgi:hypothetical protein
VSAQFRLRLALRRHDERTGELNCGQEATLLAQSYDCQSRCVSARACGALPVLNVAVVKLEHNLHGSLIAEWSGVFTLTTK